MIRGILHIITANCSIINIYIILSIFIIIVYRVTLKPKNKLTTSNKQTYILDIIIILIQSVLCTINQYLWFDSYSKPEIDISFTLYLIICSLIHLVINDIKIYTVVVEFITTSLNAGNILVYEGKGRPLQFYDFYVIKTGISVADKYHIRLNDRILTALLISVLHIIIIVGINNQNNKGKYIKIKIYRRIISLVMIIIGIICFNNTVNKNIDIFKSEDGFKESNYGLIINISKGYYKSRSNKFDNYDDIKIALDNYEELEFNNIEGGSKIPEYEFGNYYNSLNFMDGYIGENPDNIIIIMAETLCLIDCECYRNECIEYNAEYIPYIKSLIKNPDIISGILCSPYPFGGTANTEYELLTGSSIEQFAMEQYPYLGKIKNKYPSMANIAKSNGYTTTVIHNFKKSNYNRDNVYNFLGFDEKYFDDSVEFKDADYIRDYIRDENGLNLIKRQIEKQDKTFAFFVTMQGHGGYSKDDLTGKYLEEYKNLDIKPNYSYYKSEKSINGSIDSSVEKLKVYTVVQNDLDKSIKEFIEYIKSIDEKTMVLVFGDHRWVDEESIDPRAIDRYTPFFIWANYELPKIPNNCQLIASPIYFGPIICKLANLSIPEYYNLLCKMYEYMPVIGKDCYITHNLKYFSNYDDIPDKTVIDIARAITYEQLNGIRKEFYWID